MRTCAGRRTARARSSPSMAPSGSGGAHITADGEALDVVNVARRAASRVPRHARSSPAKLGFDIPAPSLRYWVLGVPDPAHPADEVLDPAEQRLSALTQDGWQSPTPLHRRAREMAARTPHARARQRAGQAPGRRLAAVIEAGGGAPERSRRRDPLARPGETESLSARHRPPRRRLPRAADTLPAHRSCDTSASSVREDGRDRAARRAARTCRPRRTWWCAPPAPCKRRPAPRWVPRLRVQQAHPHGRRSGRRQLGCGDHPAGAEPTLGLRPRR